MKKFIRDKYRPLGSICATCLPDRPPPSCLHADPYQFRNPPITVSEPCGLDSRENYVAPRAWSPPQTCRPVN